MMAADERVHVAWVVRKEADSTLELALTPELAPRAPRGYSLVARFAGNYSGLQKYNATVMRTKEQNPFKGR